MIEVNSFSNNQELTAKAAQDAEQILLEAIAERGKARLVITGGTLGIQILSDLRKLGLPLEKIEIMVGDERFVPLDHADRNEYQALEAWPELANFNLRRFPATGRPVDAAADAMSLELEAEFGDIESPLPCFDLVLLGMGPDGHVASLFPDKSHAVSWVVAEHASPKPPSQRLSLSYGALNRSRAVFFLASGEAKREAAQCAIAKADCDLPAAMVSGLELTRWYVDSEISRGL